jgi:sugar lactone lactonase YvrE
MQELTSAMYRFTIARSAFQLFLSLLTFATTTFAAPTPSSDSRWELDTLVPGSVFRGIHGLAFGPDGHIYTGSVIGQAIYRVDPASGITSVAVPPPLGLADDIEFAADGTMYWTGFFNGSVYKLAPGSHTPTQLAADLPGMNSLALDNKGRLFATQVYLGDALWEIDTRGVAKPRLIQRDIGGLNGFDFGPDNRLCGPLWFKGQVVCIDVDSGATEVMTEKMRAPAAANFNSRGELFVLDNESGEIFRIDLQKHQRKKVAAAPANLDNLAFDAEDRLFVTNMSDNAIYEVPFGRKKVRLVAGGPPTLPSGIAVGGNELFAAGIFSISRVDLQNGAVRNFGGSLAMAGAGFVGNVAARGNLLASTSFGGKFAHLWDIAKQTRLAAWSDLDIPTGVVFLDDDRIVVAEAGSGRLLLLDRRTPETREVIAEGLRQPMTLVHHAGRYFVSEALAGAVSEIDATGKRRVVMSGLARPEGLARLSDGRLVVADTGNARVLLIDPVSGNASTLISGLHFALPDIPGYPAGILPSGVAVDDADTIYVSVDGDGSIRRLRKMR